MPQINLTPQQVEEALNGCTDAQLQQEQALRGFLAMVGMARILSDRIIGSATSVDPAQITPQGISPQQAVAFAHLLKANIDAALATLP